MIKEDLIAVGIIGVAAVAGLWYAKNKIAQAVPQVVKDGVEAAGVIGTVMADAVLHPLDAFGIVPSDDAAGAPKWTKTVPWESADTVSNNDAGINYNWF